MMLTGKAKQDFVEWVKINTQLKSLKFWYKEDGLQLNALIIEWLDSLGKWRDSFYEIDNETLDGMNVTFNYTCMRAIEHANKKYNADAKEDTDS